MLYAIENANRKLLVLLALALCWAHRTGEWLTAQKPLTIKKLGRKAKSIFRHNFDRMRLILLNLEQHNADFHKVLHFLSCT